MNIRKHVCENIDLVTIKFPENEYQETYVRKYCLGKSHETLCKDGRVLIWLESGRRKHHVSWLYRQDAGGEHGPYAVLHKG